MTCQISVNDSEVVCGLFSNSLILIAKAKQAKYTGYMPLTFINLMKQRNLVLHFSRNFLI